VPNKITNNAMSKLDQLYMLEAIKEAQKAFYADEVPVGAVIVYNGKIIARAHNQMKLLKDPTAHAEMIAITQAASWLKSERLINTIMFVTIEPCAMCAGAMVLARINKIVYGAADPKTGSFGSVFDINKLKLNHRISVTRNICADECASLLKEFFRKKRSKYGEVA